MPEKAQEQPAQAKRSQRLGQVLTATLALFLASAWVVGLAQPKASQNSAPPSAPEFTSVDHLFDSTKYAKLDTVIRSKVPLGNLIIPTIADFGYEDLQRSMRSEVWQGSDGYLFFGPQFACGKNASRERFAQWAARQSQQPYQPLTIVMITDKAASMREKLRPAFGPDPVPALTACLDATTNDLNRIAQENSSWIQMLAPSTEQGARFGQPTYYRGDTHWSPGASTMLPEAIARQIGGPGLQETVSGSLTLGKNRNPYGDLFVLGGVSGPQLNVRMPQLQMPGSGSTTLRDLAPVGINPMSHARTPGGPIPGKTLLFRDSYLTAAFDATVPLFEDVTIVHADDMGAYFRSTDETFDRIIEETVQWTASDHLAMTVDNIDEIITHLKPRLRKYVVR